MSRSATGTAVRTAGAKLADLVRANLQPASGDYVLREQAAQARLAASSGAKGPDIERLRLRGMLNSTPRQWPGPDSAGTARLNELQADLAAVGRLFPEVETEITICWLACSLLEGAWRARAEEIPSTDRQECDCALCSSLPVPPPRERGDYAWRRSDSPPLAYITAVTAALTCDRTRPRGIQTDSAAVGAELFHNLHRIPTGKEDTALLAYMFGCAHPHFLWNCLGHDRTPVEGDWLDG